MSRSAKIILLALLGLVGLLGLVAAVLLFFVDANIYKTRMEAAASGVLGMEVSIEGRVGIGFLPGLLVTLEGVHIRNRAVDVAFAKEARLEIDLLPLLMKEVRVEKIELKSPRIIIERDRDGQFNFENPEAAAGALDERIDGISIEFRFL